MKTFGDMKLGDTLHLVRLHDGRWQRILNRVDGIHVVGSRLRLCICGDTWIGVSPESVSFMGERGNSALFSDGPSALDFYRLKVEAFRDSLENEIIGKIRTFRRIARNDKRLRERAERILLSGFNSFVEKDEVLEEACKEGGAK